MKDINITQSFLPPIEEYESYLKKIWENKQLTNQGPFLVEFEDKIRNYLKVDNFHFVTNGTLALQLALRALNVTSGEVITTPFSYVATTSAILWENCKPVYVDIDPETLCIDPDKVEAAITKETKAILAVHVFGYSCDIEKLDIIAKKHNIKLIYDAAHAFGVINPKTGKSLLSYGDISICSFHATKIFHTIEGGGIIVRDREVSRKVELMKRFGHTGDTHYTLGMNAKASEFQAVMGLCNLKYINEIIKQRKELSDIYSTNLNNEYTFYKKNTHKGYNYSYYPILLKNEKHLQVVVKKLNENHIFPRRYFYPSLNTLSYLEKYQPCPKSEDISNRILCLPLYHDLDKSIIIKICEDINSI